MNVSSPSYPISSLSFNSEFDSNCQVSSTHKLFSNYLNGHQDYGYEKTWFILTDEISYTIYKTLYTNLEYKPTQLD